jgi:hypothetical protein
MPELNHQLVDYYNLVDGVDTISSAIKLGTTKLRDAQNINLFPVGGLSWRNGYSRLESSSSSSNAVSSLYQARFSAGTNTLIRTIGTKLEKMDNLDGTWDDLTGVLTISAGANNVWNWAMLNDIVVGANDTNTCLQINSSLTAAVLAGSPVFTSALFPVEYRGYMFYFNTVESGTRQPDRGRFSDLNAPNSFTMLGSNNFIDVAKKQGGDVRGAISFNGVLYVFKRHGIYAIEFQPTRVNSSGTLFPFIENANPVVEGVGTQSQRSLCKFTTPSTHKTPGQELVFFVDQFGSPRIFDGRTSLVVGYPISMARNSNVTSLADMDRSRLPYVYAVNYPERNQIHLFMTEDGNQHDTDWVLDYTTGFAWTRNSFADDFNCGALVENTSGQFRLYFGTYDGKTMLYDTTQTDNGTAISSYAVLGDAFVNSPIVQSNWQQLEIRGVTGSESQEVTIDYYVNGSDTSSKTDSFALTTDNPAWDEENWDEFDWGTDGIEQTNKDIYMDAKTLRVKLSNTTTNATFATEGLTLFAVPKGWAQ